MTLVFFLTVFCFNPRICKRCDINFRDKLTFLFSFNPRICKRCDLTDLAFVPLVSVSIHASVKDATRIIYSMSSTPVVSIHASVKDATIKIDDSYFRSRVSIHASVKDATKSL